MQKLQKHDSKSKIEATFTERKQKQDFAISGIHSINATLICATLIFDTSNFAHCAKIGKSNLTERFKIGTNCSIYLVTEMMGSKALQVSWVIEVCCYQLNV